MTVRPSIAARVSVWWDLEDCRIPAGLQAQHIVERLRRTLSLEEQLLGAVCVSACGDFEGLQPHLRDELERSGVNLHHVPRGKQEERNNVFLVGLLSWILVSPPPSPVFLICGERDTSVVQALHSLHMQKYRVFLAYPSGARISSSLLEVAVKAWQWESLIGEIRKTPVTLQSATATFSVQMATSRTHLGKRTAFAKANYLQNSSLRASTRSQRMKLPAIEEISYLPFHKDDAGPSRAFPSPLSMHPEDSDSSSQDVNTYLTGFPPSLVIKSRDPAAQLEDSQPGTQQTLPQESWLHTANLIKLRSDTVWPGRIPMPPSPPQASPGLQAPTCSSQVPAPPKMSFASWLEQPPRFPRNTPETARDKSGYFVGEGSRTGAAASVPAAIEGQFLSSFLIGQNGPASSFSVAPQSRVAELESSIGVVQKSAKSVRAGKKCWAQLLME